MICTKIKYARERKRRNVADVWNSVSKVPVIGLLQPGEMFDVRHTEKPIDKKQMQMRLDDIEKQMKAAAKAYDFERAAQLRDILFELKAEQEEKRK